MCEKYIYVRIHCFSRFACQHALQKKKVDTPYHECEQAYLSIFGMVKNCIISLIMGIFERLSYHEHNL